MVTDEQRAVILLDYFGKKLAQYNKHFHDEDLGIAALCLAEFSARKRDPLISQEEMDKLLDVCGDAPDD